MRRQLGDLAEIEYGSSPNEVRTDFSDFPMFGTGGQVGFASKPLFKAPLAVVARKGTLDKPSYTEKDCWVIDTAYAVMPKNGIDAKWLFYNLDSYNLVSLNEATGVPSISREYLRRIEFEYFEEKEQQKIAKILTTVDNLIEKTEALIEKYQAIKQGMMHDLFTRGIDTNGQLRPSYHDAPQLYKQSELGWIPKEWDVRTVYNLGDRSRDTVQTGPFGAQLHAEDYVEEGIPLILIRNINDYGLDTSDIPKITVQDAQRLSRYALKKNDVVFSRVGRVGSCFLCEEQHVGWIISGQTLRIRLPEGAINPNYFLSALIDQRSQDFISGSSVGTTRTSINTDILESLPIPIPSKREQQIIANALNARIRVANVEIYRLSKYKKLKKGLMQDLLTGKVRVKV